MLPENFALLSPEQQETYLVNLLQEKQKEIDTIMKLLGKLRGKKG